MAATYYAQILARFDWARIVRSFDGVEADVRSLAEVEASHPDYTSLNWRLGVENGWQHDLVTAIPCRTRAPNSLSRYFHDGEWVATFYVGSVMNLFPSGKFYTPWTSNQTSDDVDKDARFVAAWDRVLDKFGLFTLSGEGDPTDVLVARTFEI